MTDIRNFIDMYHVVLGKMSVKALKKRPTHFYSCKDDTERVGRDNNLFPLRKYKISNYSLFIAAAMPLSQTR